MANESKGQLCPECCEITKKKNFDKLYICEICRESLREDGDYLEIPESLQQLYQKLFPNAFYFDVDGNEKHSPFHLIVRLRKEVESDVFQIEHLPSSQEKKSLDNGQNKG